MLEDMLSNFSHGLADGNVIIKQLTMSASIPLREGGQLLRDGVEEANNDTNRSRLHVITELVDSDGVRHTVMAVELDLFPDSQEDGSQHEDGRPVLETLATVNGRVKSRELLENLLLKLTPHIGHGALDLEVDHDRGNNLAEVLGVLVINLALHGLLCRRLLNHGNVKSKVVSHDKLESLANDRQTLLNVEPVGSLEELSDEGGTLEVVINELLEALIDVLVEVLGESLDRDTLVANVETLSADLEVNRLLVGKGRLNPVNLEAALIGNKHLANHDREAEAIAVGDPHEGLLLGETLDVEDGHATAEVTLVVGLPVLHEVTNILDIDTSAGHLPQTSVRRLATSARLTLVASLLEELATEAGTELPDLARLLTLLGKERSATPANLLLTSAILLASRVSPTNDGLGRLGSRALSWASNSPRWGRNRAGAVGSNGPRRAGLDGYGSDSGRGADLGGLRRVVVVVTGAATAVAVGQIHEAIGLGREGRVGEGNFLIAAKIGKVRPL